MNKKRIAFFLPNLSGGGAERVAVNLLKGMLELNIPLDLVLASAEGPYLDQVPQEVRTVNLAAGRVIKAILPLSSYLKQARPYALISHLGHANVIACIAKNIANTKTRLVLVEHNTLSNTKSKLARSRFVGPFMKYLYPQSDAIVGVSQGVSADLQSQLDLPVGRVATIYNPVIDNELITRSKTSVDHPWFRKGAPPVFLTAGRLSAQKDFTTLIKAFAILRKQVLARLIILGEGECRDELESLIDNLGITNDVSMPGFYDNPYSYMNRATAFVLSSRWEGLPTVLIEAMACGCPVISTDCLSGPSEILESGTYGLLVPIGDTLALSKAMLQVLDFPLNRDVLVKRGMYFSHERAVSEYLSLLDYY